MEDKKKNPVVDLIARLAMGIGGGMTGQNYLGEYERMEFEKWKDEHDPYSKAQKEATLLNAAKLRSELGLPPDEAMMGYISSMGGGAVGQPQAQPPQMGPQQMGPQGAPQPGMVPPLSGAMQGAPMGAPGMGDFIPTQLEKTPFGGLQPSKYELSPEFKARQEIETNWKKEVTKNQKTAWDNFNQTHALLKNTMAQFKAATAEMKAKGVPTGLATKAIGGVAKGLELQGYPQTKAYEGQVIETAMSLSKIITGGARIIKSVINQLIKTLPEASGIQEDADAKLAQSFRNAFTKSLGRPLTKDEQTYMDAQVKDLLATPAATIPGDTPQKVKTFSFQVNGENYVNIPQEEVIDFINSFPEKDNIYDLSEVRR